MCFDKIRLYLNAEFMSHNNYNNNSINYNYGFGSNNYSNIINYTTPQQDTVSQVVNLLNQCSIEQLEKINGKLAEIKQQKENQFWNDIYTWCLNNQQILNRINKMELGAALQCSSVLSNEQQSSLFTYIHLKCFINEVLQHRKSDRICYITDRKDVNVFKQNAWQIVQNAQQAISYIQAQNQTNYNQHLHNGKMRAQTQKFMKNNFLNWCNNMVKNGLWIPTDGPVPNYIMYTDSRKNADREAFCNRVWQIRDCKGDVDKLAEVLGCQPSGVLEKVKEFMQQCNDFIQKYGKHHNIANYNTNYGLGGGYNYPYL